jgi:alkylation response protein AidB-like acyl-CoA dehydrogenase
MDLLPTEEQQQIIDTAANFLAHEFPVKQLLNLTDGKPSFTRTHLHHIASMGWIGIGLPEDYDGVGCGLAEEALLFAELGRNLLPPAVLASVLAAHIAAQSGSSDYLRPILGGELKVALAISRPAMPLHIGPSIDGEFLVYEAEDADLVLVADQGGAALVLLSSLSCMQTEKCIDSTLDLSCRIATAAPALCFAPVERENIFLRGSLLSSAMLLGIAEATLERSVQYAKAREQFGKPIGSFQAIKHYCAEMAIRCESVRAMLYHASITLQAQLSAGPFDTYSLKALAIDAAQHNANTAVQIHGGMGYTQEMDIHLFVKRAQVLSTLFGSERFHLKKLLAERAPD